MKKTPLEVIKKYGFNIEQTGDGWELQQHTPAGEDWIIILDKLRDIVSFAEDFDPEEEFVMWIEAKRNGVKGVPGPMELWKDQLWKQKTLNKIASKIEKEEK